MTSRMFGNALALLAAQPIVAAAQTLQSAALRLSPTQAIITAVEMPMDAVSVFAMVLRATGRSDNQL